MADAVRRVSMKVVVSVKGMRTHKMRVWLGTALIKLGAFVIGVGRVDIEVK